ncbi:MAG: hypothetical protein ABW208_28440 [Pyrinomonadaceae bacterium]
MKRLTCAALLAFAFAVPAGYAQDSSSTKKEAGQTTEKASKQKAKEGQDCDTNRAGVRCSRPKPKKVWFWGKA